MKRIFYPESIVVIGVSERPDNLARYIVANLITFKYQGDLYAVGLRTGEVYSVPIVDSLDKIPDGLDLAVILTPAHTVPDLMETCGRKGIQRVVIESAGFGEFSEEGRRLEEQLLEIARKWNIRFVGPNCISVINLETGVCLPFGPISPDIVRRGPASIVSQSGGVSLTYLGSLSQAGVGVNKVISIGNKTDLDETDYLTYLLNDDETQMVSLYLESISDGRLLMDLARSSTKPIIIHKANRGKASQSVAFSHTAALADDDRIVEAAFKQTGILRAEGFRDMVAIAQGLSLPHVQGDELLIISRSGGHAVSAADSAERHGFQLPPLPDSFNEAVRSLFSADVISPTNPLDLGVIYDFQVYAQIVEQSLQALSPDAVLLINTYSQHEAEDARQLARRVGEIVRELGHPIAVCNYTDVDDVHEIQEEIGLPVFNDINGALRGLASSREWTKWLQNPNRIVHSFSKTTQYADSENRSDDGELTADQALNLCETYGIAVAPWEIAHNPEEAMESAERIGYPVAIKIISREMTHKTDYGGVTLGLRNSNEVRTKTQDVLHRITGSTPETQTNAFMIQQMVSDGIEVILGGRRDPHFGPVVMFGIGGIYVEIYDDVTFRVAPLDDFDARAMIEEVRGARLFEGYRGKAPIDRERLIQALLSLSQLMVENPNIGEVDINPLIVTSEGAIAVDARAVIVNVDK
jgi:acyl-CoA synthetase (NDP forming)